MFEFNLLLFEYSINVIKDNLFDNNLILRRNYEFKKSLSNQKLLEDDKPEQIQDPNLN